MSRHELALSNARTRLAKIDALCEVPDCDETHLWPDRLRRATERDIATLERHRPFFGEPGCSGDHEGRLTLTTAWPCPEVAPLLDEYAPNPPAGDAGRPQP